MAPVVPYVRMGRASLYSDELAAALCERVAAGESLKKMCLDDPCLPSFGTVFRWLRENPEFDAMYQAAIRVKAHGYVDESVHIADETKKAVDMVQINSAKLRVDTRFRAAAKIDPGAWGDRVKIDAAIDVQATIIAGVRALSDDELVAIMAIAEKMLAPAGSAAAAPTASSEDGEDEAAPQTESGAPDDPGAPLDGEVLPPL